MNANEIVDVLMDVPIFGKKRNPKNAEDFGDVDTIGLHLKQPNNYEKFGVYLGQLRNSKWGVGIKDLITFGIVDIEEHDSLEELKRNWILD